MKVEDNCCVYKGEDAFLRLPTSFGKSVCYEVLSFVCYAIVLLVSPLVSLMIAKFICLSECCFVVALLSALYVYNFQISSPYIIPHGQAT